MIGLLANPPQPEYPADYLLARLMARQPRWDQELAPADGNTTAGWAALAAEFRWLYGQLHHRLRRELAPLFVYFELRPLFLFLRGVASGNAGKGSELLATGLLADGLKQRLCAAQELPVALRLLERAWPVAPPLHRLYAASGLAAVEEGLTRQLLEQGGQQRASLRAFWAALVDLENIMALAKRLRWQARRPFGYSTGGTLAVRRFVLAERNQEPLLAFSLAVPLRNAVVEGAWPLEELLRDRVQQQLRTRETSLQPAAAVAAYMWGAYGVTRRLAMASQGERR